MIAKAASALNWDGDQDTWNAELNKFRNSILNKNKYLKDEYATKSAWNTNKVLRYNKDNKTYTVVNMTKTDNSKSSG
jgi:hypothetical protein